MKIHSLNPRSAPYSIEAEQSVLGGIMLNNRKWLEVMDRISEADFYRLDHQIIWRSITELAGANKPCDFVTLVEHLRARELLQDVGGVSYLGSLANDTPSAANVDSYADIVRERSVLRGLIAAGGDIAELGYRPGGRAPGELLDAAEQQLTKLRQVNARSTGAVPFAELLTRASATVERASKHERKIPGIETGLVDLDVKIGGLQRGDLILVGGRPSMGKSALSGNIAEHVGRPEGEDGAVLVFSMEMPGEQWALRAIASHGHIPLHRLRAGDLDERAWDQKTWAEARLRRANIFVDESGGLSPLELRARARRIAMRRKLGLIVVDYIQLMQVHGTRENRTNEISEISRSLKSLAKELDVPVVALSQLNRSVEQRDNKRPRMSDLRESGGLEQDADIIAFIYRDEVYNAESAARGTAEIIIAKQRNGPIGAVRLAFHAQFTRFENLAQDWREHLPPLDDPPSSLLSPKPKNGFGGAAAQRSLVT